MNSVILFLRNFGLLIARLGLGGILLLHGWMRWQGPGQGVAKQVEYLTQFGTPYPQVVAWAAIVFELVGGLFLVLGALTPVIGLGVLVQQILTISYTKYSLGPDLMNSDGSYHGGYEYNVALGLLGLLFFVYGGGVVSLDRVFRRKRAPKDEDADLTTPG